METTMALRGEAIRLGKRALHTVPDISGLLLACSEGSLWVTLDNDPRNPFSVTVVYIGLTPGR